LVSTAALLAGLTFVTLLDAGSPSSPPTKKATPEEIHKLIEQLGSEKFAKRVEAQKLLEAIGEPAIGTLRKAAESSKDAEIRNTARAIVEAYEREHSGVLRVFKGHGSRVNGVAISSDSKRALSASWDASLRLWNLENGGLLKEMSGHDNAIMSVTLSGDGKRALTGSSDRTMRLWDLEAGKEVGAPMLHPNTVWDVVFSPDGKKALSACSDGNARLWDLEAARPLLTLESHKGGKTWTVAFTPDGNAAVVGGGSTFEGNNPPRASLRLWDLTTGKEIRQFEGHASDVRRVALSRDGKQLLSGSFDGSMRLWDLQTGKEIRRYEGPGNFVEAVAFTPDGKRAVCAYGPQIVEAVYDADPRCSLRVWDLATARQLHQLKGHSGPVLSFALSGDGQFLVSGSGDNTMRYWRMPK
jgi:WD40 repeat protein